LSNPDSNSGSLSKRPLNILLLNSLKFMGGGETWMLNMAGHLARRGHHPLIVARPKTVFLQQAEALGLPTRALWIAGDLNPILLGKLVAITKKHRTDVVIANVSRDIRISGLMARLTRRFSVVGLHQVDRPIAGKWNYRLTFNHLADAVVVNSEATRQTLIRESPWLNINRLRVIHHGIEPGKIAGDGRRVRQELGLKDSDLVLGFVGRLCGQKGISTLLEAMEILEKKHPDVHLLIAGTGVLEKKVRQFASTRPRVHVLGFRSDIPDVMSACDVLLVPSIWEGFGLVVVEAMVAGVPCVASAISSLPEIVESEVNGLLVPPKDPAALAMAATRLLSDPDLRARFRKAGGETVESRFTVERMMCSYESLFLDMIQKRGKHAFTSTEPQ
jgi:glycosyltransferase involved in cell wall biosynthesis